MANISRWIFERNGNAVASVLFAVAGLAGFGVILGPVAVVTGEQRITELARMLSGDEGGDAARRHAVELLGGR